MKNILLKKRLNDEEIILNDRELASELRLKKELGELEIVYSVMSCNSGSLKLLNQKEDGLIIFKIESMYIFSRGIGLVLKDIDMKNYIIATIVLRDSFLFNNIKSMGTETIEFLRECYNEIMEEKKIFSFDNKGPRAGVVSIIELIEKQYQSIVYKGVFNESEILDLNKVNNIFKSKDDCISEWNKYAKENVCKFKEEVIKLLKELGQLNASIEVYDKLVAFDKNNNSIHSIATERIEEILQELNELDCKIKNLEINS